MNKEYMIKITVNHNSDTLEIDTRDSGLIMDLKNPSEVEHVLEELLNILEPKDVILERIDENNRKTIGEW